MTSQQHTPHGPHPGQPGPAGASIASELRRLTARDRWLIDLLAEHLMLSTEQITALAFATAHTARIRLNLLRERGVLARFRDCVRPGSQSWRWTLGLGGETYLAARAGLPPPRPAAVRTRIDRLAANPRLGHLHGVNGFFVDLAAHARTTPGTTLSVWWSEHTCVREVTGQLAHPDGHGVWTETGHTAGWWLEYDTGSEPMHRVIAKLDGYQRLQRATGTDHAVIFWLHSPAREDSFHARARGHPATAVLTVATAHADPQASPAGPLWWPVGHTARVRLAQLPAAPAAEAR